MSKSYSEKLKDPKWQKKRLEILNRDEFTCQSCFDNESTLHIHHKVYNKDCEPWDIDNESLITLCEDCHENEKLSTYTFVLVNESVKKKFLSVDAMEIAQAFHSLKMVHIPGVMSGTIKWVFSDKKIMLELVEKYLRSLNNVKKIH